MNPQDIYKSPWFALEKPLFDKITELADPWLTVLNILLAAATLYIAFRGPTVLKAVWFTYMVMP